MVFIKWTSVPGLSTCCTGEVYVCGVTEEHAPLPANPADIAPTPGACAELRATISRVCAAIASAEIEREQACFLPLSPDNTPLIGFVPGTSRAILATGHGCWGILNAPATGLAVAQLIMHGKASVVDLAPFDPSRI